MSSSRGAWPTFGRDAADVAWRPDPATAAEARLARFLRSSGEPSLEALQARAVGDPAWFWGSATDDIAIPWTRRPREVADFSGGPAWTRWWIGGSFDWSWAAVEPRAARDPDVIAITWEGEDGSVRSVTNAELTTVVRVAAGQLAGLGVGAGDRVGILLPMLPETVVAVLAWGDLHPDLLGLRCAGDRIAPCRLRRKDADHGRRLPAPRSVGRSEVGGRRGGRSGALGRACPGRPPCG